MTAVYVFCFVFSVGGALLAKHPHGITYGLLAVAFAILIRGTA